MKTAVVITALDEAKTIRALIEALITQTHPANEIVLVDGGSTDDTAVIVSEYESRCSGLRLIQSPGSNISQGRNRGIAATKCPVIAITDAGCIPTNTWLENLLASFDNQAGPDLVCGSFRISPQTDLEDCIGRCSGTARLRIQGQDVRPSARSLAFTQAVWQTIGGFPEHVYAGEDLWFVLTLAEQGYRLQKAPDAVVSWRPRSSYRDVLRQFHLYARDTVRMGLTWRIYRRTLIQDIILVGLVIWTLASPTLLPGLLLTGAIAAYLYRKVQQGCFATPGWRTIYRVPLVLSTIHLGVVTGITMGLSMQVRERVRLGAKGHR
jgi:glycosyltransferase involved in cell wall biosynthesis